MKRSLIASAAILSLGLLPGILQQKRLGELRENHDELVIEAGKVGISSFDVASGVRQTKSRREEMGTGVDRISSSLIGFAGEMEGNEKAGISPDDEFRMRSMELMKELAELDASQIQLVIQQLRNADGISTKTRSDLIALAVMSSADEYPEVALALYIESLDLLKESHLSEQVIATALGRWLEREPDGALAWIRKNSEQHSDSVNDDMRRSVISDISKRDPKVAFGLIARMEFEDPENAIHAIMFSGAGDPECRTNVLIALREYLGGIPDEEYREQTGSDAFELLARTTDTEDCDSLIGWIEESRLTEKEKAQFAKGLAYFNTKQATGKWVEWLSANLSEENQTHPVRDLVSEWTQQDYQAAGKWLATVPEGSARVTAVEAYAEAVAEYDPQVAAQWALTLPSGEGREKSLRAVHDNWPSDDPAGASAFAAEHGLE